MLLNSIEAIKAFEGLPLSARAPAHHPLYVLADSRRSADLEPFFFVFSEGSDVYYHAFHRARVPGTDFFDIQSPYGYGGPLSSSENPEFLRRACQAYSQHCSQASIMVEFLRFHPILRNWRFSEADSQELRSTVVVELGRPNLFDSYETRTRTAVRKAVKSGLTVSWAEPDEFMLHFPSIYESTMKGLGADPSYFFPKDYYRALAELPRASLGLCHLEKTIVGAAIFLGEGNILEYHLSGSTLEGRKLGATNLLLHEAFQLGQKKGLTFAHLGGGNNNDPENSLFFFKQGFSSKLEKYRIGKRIFLPAEYSKLKEKWAESHSTKSDRLLFYRE